MNKIKFTKMHGLGNDFVVLDSIQQNFTPTPELIRAWGNRHVGIGFDQLLLIEKSNQNEIDFIYRIFNADGQEVSQCGNGARCAAIYLRDKKMTDKNLIKLATQNGELEVSIKNNDQVTVNMGIPKFDPQKIPFLAQQEALSYTLSLENQTLEFCALSIGNPHCVLVVNKIEETAIAALGAVLTKYPQFPEAVNVGFMQVVNPHEINLRVYERGAGMTQACGSGACAAVIAGRTLQLLDAEVVVKQLGGNLKISWEGRDKPVYLTGPAVTVFDGEINQ